MSAVLNSSGDLMSFFKTDLKVVGLRSGMMVNNDNLKLQASLSVSGYCPSKLQSKLHERDDLIRCFSLPALLNTRLIRSLLQVASERPQKICIFAMGQR